MKHTATRTIPSLSVVVTPEGGEFVACCVEFNVCAYGKTLEEVREHFIDALIRYVLVHEQVGRDPFGEPREAGSKAHRLWQHVQASGAEVREFRIPQFTTSQRGDVEHVAGTTVRELVSNEAA